MKEILKCMDKIPQGVFLVGAKKGEGYNLMTAAFVTQVSFNPARKGRRRRRRPAALSPAGRQTRASGCRPI